MGSATRPNYSSRLIDFPNFPYSNVFSSFIFDSHSSACHVRSSSFLSSRSRSFSKRLTALEPLMWTKVSPILYLLDASVSSRSPHNGGHAQNRLVLIRKLQLHSDIIQGFLLGLENGRVRESQGIETLDIPSVLSISPWWVRIVHCTWRTDWFVAGPL